MKRSITFIVLAVFAMFLVPSLAYASLISVPVSDWVDSRSTDATDSEIIAYANWADDAGGFKISWDITYDSIEELYTYVYTFTNINEQTLVGELSHWILEVTNPSVSDDFDFLEAISEDSLLGPDTFSEGSGNPLMPSGGIYAIKFDQQGGTFTLVTPKDPVWGDFYAKDGKSAREWNVAYNAGFGSIYPDETTTDFSPWIATPDGGPVIPEPSTLLLLGSGLVGMALKWKRRKI